MGIKPLGTVKTIVEAAGMGISYAYDDLVFLEHNSFLLQFTDNDREIRLHVNREADETAVHGDMERLREAARNHAMECIRGGHYILTQEGEDSIRIAFTD
ncbi:MAG: hypothetical protein ACOY3Z_12785 [Thermodesulfobacteriota bacterium]